MPLCEALRQKDEVVRPEGASSSMNLRPGRVLDGRFELLYVSF